MAPNSPVCASACLLMLCCPGSWVLAHVGEADVLEEILVVGSRIPQVDPAETAPVYIVDRAAIEQTGSMYLSEVLQRLPFDGNGNFNDRDPLSAALGGTGFSLRGLGANSVLVLVNGQRAATYGFARRSVDGNLVSFVDLNSVPATAIERIEVLKDGASAMYGSDAIAGVVNIVLRERFEGIEVQVRAGGTEGGGADERAIGGMFGWIGDRADLSVVASYSDRDALAWADRSISRSANHSSDGGMDLRDVSATNFLIGTTISTFGADCEARNDASAAFELLETGTCLYDSNQAIVQPDAARWGITTIGNFALNDSLRIHVEASFLRSDMTGQREPNELSDVTFPAQNPWNPFGQDVFSYYQFTETGPRTFDVESEHRRWLIRLDGSGDASSWEVGWLSHQSSARQLTEGHLDGRRVELALQGVDLNADGVLQQSEFLNLFSPASHPSSADLIDSLTVTTQRHSRTDLSVLFGKLSRRWFDLPGGSAVYALGLEYRTESLRDESDPISVGSHIAALEPPDRYFGMRVDLPLDQIDPYAYIDVFDLPQFHTIVPSGAPVTWGERYGYGAYGEIQLPISSGLDMQAALRIDVDEGLGSHTSPRLALRWQALPDHALRGSWGQGYRAPSLAEVNEGASARAQASWDPEICPEPGFLIPSLAGGCVVKSFLTIGGGNPGLEVETSESWSAGLVSIWMDDLFTSSADCWQVTVKDRIVALGPERILRHERSLGPGIVERRLPDPHQSAAGIGGYANRIFDLYTNAAKQKVRGCDLQLNSEFAHAGLGVVSAQLIGTHVISNSFQAIEGEPAEEMAGTYGSPENRANLNVYWTRDMLRGGVQGRYIGGYGDAVGDGRVDDHMEWDLQLGIRPRPWFDVVVGVTNVFDERPPRSASLHGFATQFYDMRGRFFYLQTRLGLATTPSVR